MTPAEYELLLEAAELRIVDLDYRNHLQAYLNFAVQATKGKSGRPVYRKFKSFYDYEKEQERVSRKKKKTGKFIALSKYLKEKEDGGAI